VGIGWSDRRLFHAIVSRKYEELGPEKVDVLFSVWRKQSWIKKLVTYRTPFQNIRLVFGFAA
jgi:hypothetical protein